MPDTASPPVRGGAERRESPADRRRRSRVVAQARRWLPVAIGALLLALLVAVIVAAVLGQARPGNPAETMIRMVNPRFLGRNDDGEAFVIRAREAVRITGVGSRVRLYDPDMTLEDDSRRPTRVVAKAGVYDEVTEVLHLRNQVVLDSANGRFRTDDAVIDSNAGTIMGSAPIAGVGPTGNIRADRYALYDGGARMTFSGNVRARLLPPASQTPAASAVGAEP